MKTIASHWIVVVAAAVDEGDYVVVGGDDLADANTRFQVDSMESWPEAAETCGYLDASP